MPWSEYLSRWTVEDRSIVVALALEKATQCPMCSTAQWEWDEDANAYVPVVTTCPGCAHKDRLRDSEDLGKLPGASVRLVPPEQAEAMRQMKPKRPKSAREKARQ